MLGRKHPGRYVRKTAKAYSIDNPITLDAKLQEFVNLLQCTHNDHYLDEEVWIDFIDECVKDLYGLWPLSSN